MIPFEIGKYAAAVTSWLNYQIVIGKEAVFSEGFMAFPISEYINICGKDNFKPEFPHPAFSRRRIDFVVENISTVKIGAEALEYKVDLVFENKWVSERTGDFEEKCRVFADLMRLVFYKLNAVSEHKQIKAYFLIAGRADFFNSNFELLKKKIPDSNAAVLQHYSGGHSQNTNDLYYAEWFNFSDYLNKHTILLNKADESYRSVYRDFIDSYSSGYKAAGKTNPPLMLPNSISTRLVYLTSPEDAGFTSADSKVRVGIWEIDTDGTELTIAKADIDV
ncbi:MAG: hypothetical protein V4543_02015 [Bacteroidota bacterium]